MKHYKIMLLQCIKDLLAAILLMVFLMSMLGMLLFLSSTVSHSASLNESMEEQHKQLYFMPGDPANSTKMILYTDPGKVDTSALDKQIQHPKRKVSKHQNEVVVK